MGAKSIEDLRNSILYKDYFVKQSRGGVSTNSANAPLVISTWFVPSYPTFYPYANVASAGLNGISISGPISGALSLYNSPSNTNKQTIIAEATHTFTGTSNFQSSSQLLLYDRLWHNVVNCSITTVQSITMPSLPPRDDNGSSNGDGVFLMIEFTTASGESSFIQFSSGFNINIGYTNSNGVAGQVFSSNVLLGATLIYPQCGIIVPITAGIRSIQSIQILDTSVFSNIMSFSLNRQIYTGPTSVYGKTGKTNLISTGCKTIYPNSVLYPVFNTNTNQLTSGVGSITYAEVY